MKTKAPSSMKRFAAARPMPVAPPVITAVFPFSLVMTCSLLVSPSHLVARGGLRDAQDGSAGARRSVRKRAHRWCEIDPAGRLNVSATIAVTLVDVLDTGFGRRTARCG